MKNPIAMRVLPLAAALIVAACAKEKAEETSAADAPAPVAENEEAAAPPAKAAVAMPDRFSADAARQVLLEGGNAVDAAVAASFVLAVTYPEAGNIGGGGFMTLYMNGKTDFIDYREMAPAGASRDMYLDAAGEIIPGSSTVGALASGVPGAVAGLAETHAKYGTLPWARLVAPAITLARDGFPVPDDLAQSIARKAESTAGKTNFATYFNVGAGELLKQPELAATLLRIAEEGAAGFYAGETARATAAHMEKIGGLITEADLAAYKAVWRAPLETEWNDLVIVSAPPPSSGGIGLIQLLEMKDILADAFAGEAHNSPQYVHLVAELEKRVFADRAEYLGDPDFADVPTARLIAPDYVRIRAGEVSIETISDTAAVRPGLSESEQTTHFSVLDFDGQAASVTTTLNTGFGSGVVVEGAGYLLNNEMDDFSAKPGAPNVYGVVGAEANAIEPGKRMLSSMTPTIALKDGKVAMVVGTPGGPTIFTSVFQAVVNHFEFGMSAEAATAAGRFHHQLLPKDTIMFEERIENAAETTAALEAMGYRIVPRAGYGDVHIVTVAEDGTVEAAHDPRNRGASYVIERAAE